MVCQLEQAVVDTAELAVSNCLVVSLCEHGFGSSAGGKSARHQSGFGILGCADRVQHVVRRVDVVVDRVALVPVRFHGVGGSTLLGKVNDRIRPVIGNPPFQFRIIFPDVEFVEIQRAVRCLSPESRYRFYPSRCCFSLLLQNDCRPW